MTPQVSTVSLPHTHTHPTLDLASLILVALGLRGWHGNWWAGVGILSGFIPVGVGSPGVVTPNKRVRDKVEDASRIVKYYHNIYLENTKKIQRKKGY